MTPFPMWRTDRARYRNNVRLIAERTGWPRGALQACFELEERHPDWTVSWSEANTTPGFERPAGFYASHPTGAHVGRDPLRAYGASAEELEPLLVEVPEHSFGKLGCEWCKARMWN